MAYRGENRPVPTPSNVVEVGFLGSVLHVQLPENLDEQQLNSLATTRIVQKDPDLHVCLKSIWTPHRKLLLLGKLTLGTFLFICYLFVFRSLLAPRRQILSRYCCLRLLCRIYGQYGNVSCFVNRSWSLGVRQQ